MPGECVGFLCNVWLKHASGVVSMVLSMAIRLQHDAHHYHGQYAGYKKSNGLFVMSSRKGLEAVCGLGQGRYLDRAVADFLGEPHQVCKTAVAHRKGTYILDIAFRFLQKYPGFYTTMLVRSGHALHQRGSKTFKELKSLREDLGDQTMLTFALGLVGGMQHNLMSITFQSQDVADLAWTWWRSARGEVGSFLGSLFRVPVLSEKSRTLFFWGVRWGGVMSEC